MTAIVNNSGSGLIGMQRVMRAEADGRLAPTAARDIRQALTEAEWDAMAEMAAGIS